MPFGNSLVTMTLTGAQIHDLLEDGFSYEYSSGAAAVDKVDPASIKIGGVVISAGTGYRVTVNSFLADGGDGFSVLPFGTDRLGGEVDLDALVTYFGDNTPPGVAPGQQDRITIVP